MEPQMNEDPTIVRPGPEDNSLLTQQQNHRSEAIWNGEDPGPLTCRGHSKEMATITMQDNRVIDIIKLVGLEGLFRAPSKGIDHCLITALVEQWRPKTHTFHLPHGEMSITLEDVEVILGLPIDGEVLIGPTVVEDGDWKQLCVELLGFGVPANDNTTLVGQNILISRLVQRIAKPLPHDATEMQIHQWVRVPSPKSRPSDMALIYYREQLVRMQPGQIMWQPYKADLGRLPAFCVAGKDTWMARVPLIESHLALLEMLPVGSRDHNHVRRVLNNVVGFGGGPATNGQANNGHETEPATTITLSTSTTPLSTPSRGRRATTTPSTSAAPLSTPTRGRHATTSPSTSAARGRGQPATTSPSTSAARGHGRHATTLQVVTSPEIRAPIPHTSPQLEVTPPIPDAYPQSEVPPPMVDASPQPEVPSPSPPLQPNFDLGVDFHMTPPTHPETPSYPPTRSSAPTLPIEPPRTEPMTMIPTPSLYIEHHYPPTSSSSDPLGPPVGIDIV
ncbi:hypothetical protein SO802_028829 [Lithocarpus litseifolius]|uniref:Aminotransferase-like plant mobile domain-containing protein n=1 Tax=Lithocarpus litseifolius TaxID=425828 RepID=A0AAW2BX04_9ROSI